MIPQGHPTGYPIYRLEWQGLGSLQRRLRNCMSGVRAEPFAYGAIELVELELYLHAARARHAAGDAGRAALSKVASGLWPRRRPSEAGQRRPEMEPVSLRSSGDGPDAACGP